MNFMFLAPAANTAAANPEENPWSSVIMIGIMIIMFIAMYFMVIRPGRKKQKEDEAMRSSLEIGDDITTIGGIVGKVISIRDDDETFVLETGSDKTRIRFKKWAVSSIDTPEKQTKTEEKKDKSDKSDKKSKTDNEE